MSLFFRNFRCYHQNFAFSFLYFISTVRKLKCSFLSHTPSGTCVNIIPFVHVCVRTREVIKFKYCKSNSDMRLLHYIFALYAVIALSALFLLKWLVIPLFLSFVFVFLHLCCKSVCKQIRDNSFKPVLKQTTATSYHCSKTHILSRS